jgi:replicative DNA helicase
MINYEADLAHAVLIDPQVMKRLDPCPEPADFAGLDTQAAWSAILSLHRQGEQINPISLERELGKKGPGIVSFILTVGQPAPSQAKDYAAAIFDNRKRRQLLALVDEIKKSAEEQKPDEAIALATSRISEIARERRTASYSMKDLCLAYWQNLDDYRADPTKLRQVPTGMRGLDQVLSGGGLAFGAFHIVAGGTNKGKSALCQNIALNAGWSMPVDYYTLEDDPLACGMRILSRISRIRNTNLQGYHIEKADEAPLTAACTEAMQNSVVFYEASSRAVENLSIEIINNASRRDTKLIVVDYIQKMYSRTQKENRNLSLGHVAAELFTIARRTGAAVIAASQLNRGSREHQDKPPTLSSLRDSGELEQHAHTVIMLHRNENNHLGIAEVIVAKQKNGICCTTYQEFDADCLEFRDPDEELVRRYQSARRAGCA